MQGPQGDRHWCFFDYETVRTRQTADDGFAEKKRDLERALAEEGERRDAAFAVREGALDERADDITRLRAEVAAYPARLKGKVDAAREDAIRQMWPLEAYALRERMTGAI